MNFKAKKDRKSLLYLLAKDELGLYVHSLHKNAESADRQAATVVGFHSVVSKRRLKEMGIKKRDNKAYDLAWGTT